MSLYKFVESFINENPDMQKLTREDNYNYNDFSKYFTSKVINK